MSNVHLQRHPFSRSYGVILPSSLAGVLSSALDYSSRPPVLVCGTVCIISRLEAFLGSLGSTTSDIMSRHHLSALWFRICLEPQPTGLHQDVQHLTQAVVAKMLGSGQSRVAQMEAADSSVSMELLVRSLLMLGATRKEVGRVIARDSTIPAA